MFVGDLKSTGRLYRANAMEIQSGYHVIFPAGFIFPSRFSGLAVCGSLPVLFQEIFQVRYIPNGLVQSTDLADSFQFPAVIENIYNVCNKCVNHVSNIYGKMCTFSANNVHAFNIKCLNSL